jgi:hypothetical protein
VGLRGSTAVFAEGSHGPRHPVYSQRRMLPGISPTGLRVEVAVVVIVRFRDVERVEAGGHVVIFAVYLSIADLLTVNIEQPYPIGAAFDDERALTIGGDCDGNRQRGRWCCHCGCRLGSDRHCADGFYVFALDRQHADAVIGTVGDARVPALLIAMPEGCLPASTVPS